MAMRGMRGIKVDLFGLDRFAGTVNTVRFNPDSQLEGFCIIQEEIAGGKKKPSHRTFIFL